MAKVENEQIVKDYEELSVANFYAFDKVNGLEYYSGTLESHELAKTMEQEEIKGGQDNATAIGKVILTIILGFVALGFVLMLIGEV